MNEGREAFPLDWPAGWPRAPYRQASRFGANGEKPSIGKGTKEIMIELERMSATEVVISSNLELRNDGLPRARQAALGYDPGVAVYFKRKGQAQVIACDLYDRPGCNLHACALTLDAIRGIKRWGSSQLMERAFTGFKALAQFAEGNWRSLMQLPARCEWDTVEHQYKHLAKQWHPDNQETGSDEKFKKLQLAFAAAKVEYQMKPEPA